MKINYKDLRLIKDEKVYPVDLKIINIENNIFIRRIEDAIGDISFYNDYENKLRINYELEGKMICPCAYTLEDVEVPFHLGSDEEVTNNIEDEGFYLIDGIEIEKLVYNIVLPEVPIKVVKNKKIEYSRGDGYVFVSDEEYNSSKKKDIDPRLQKLKEYKFEEDD